MAPGHGPYTGPAMKTHTQYSNHLTAGLDTKVSGGHALRGIPAILATLLMIFSIVGLTSCAGYTSAASNATPSTGTLALSANTLAFGSVPVGSTAVQTVTVTNTGTAAVSISQATISGAGFTVLGGSSAGSIPVGQSVA